MGVCPGDELGSAGSTSRGQPPALGTVGGVEGGSEVTPPRWMVTPSLPPARCKMMLSHLWLARQLLCLPILLGQQLAEPRRPPGSWRSGELPRPGEEVSSKASQGDKQYLSCSLPFTFAASNGF